MNQENVTRTGTSGKMAIVYGSTHHGNTFKVVQEIGSRYDAKLIDATKVEQADLKDYDYIGFASGIDFGKFYSSVEDFARNCLPENKKVFFLYTCAMKREGFTNSISEAVQEKHAEILGEYGCKGYNTYGPWKVIGGMNKSHPNKKEIAEAAYFVGECIGK